MVGSESWLWNVLDQELVYATELVQSDRFHLRGLHMVRYSLSPARRSVRVGALLLNVVLRGELYV
jgi:hypothetical protein